MATTSTAQALDSGSPTTADRIATDAALCVEWLLAHQDEWDDGSEDEPEERGSGAGVTWHRPVAAASR